MHPPASQRTDDLSKKSREQEELLDCHGLDHSSCLSIEYFQVIVGGQVGESDFQRRDLSLGQIICPHPRRSFPPDFLSCKLLLPLCLQL